MRNNSWRSGVPFNILVRIQSQLHR